MRSAPYNGNVLAVRAIAHMCRHPAPIVNRYSGPHVLMWQMRRVAAAKTKTCRAHILSVQPRQNASALLCRLPRAEQAQHRPRQPSRDAACAAGAAADPGPPAPCMLRQELLQVAGHRRGRSRLCAMHAPAGAASRSRTQAGPLQTLRYAFSGRSCFTWQGTGGAAPDFAPCILQQEPLEA